ncbi:MAG: HAMP domain-containing histidine kinase [Acaryochloridaceae cyanobacterium RU_4_10]|nr:HAMP domain-containing histidine kinase [Acaryochloridaceae cyanobacterium RU_4_10]
MATVPTVPPRLKSSQWQRFWGEARTRIVLWYVGIMILFVGLAIPLIRLQVVAQVDARVRADLNEEMEGFLQLLVEGPKLDDEAIIKGLREDGQPVPTGYPTTTQELESLLEIHLKRRIPEDDMFLISFVNGKFFRSSPRALPGILSQDSVLMVRWANLTRPEQGEQKLSASQYGGLLHRAEPIKFNGKFLGVFVIAHTTQGEQNEALEAFGVMVQIKLLALGLALLLIWWAASRVLAPLRLLSTTAHSISETDLSNRLPTEGNGEISDLSQTFNEMMDRLESAFKSQRHFINDAGHELRTPITIVRGHLELMGDDPQEREETVALVLDELDRMNRLVEELLLLAKTERPDFLHPEDIEVGDLMQEMHLKATGLSGDRHWNLEHRASGKIRVDRQRITEAMMNLAENAVQHTVSGDTITLGSRLNHQNLEIWVKDTGEGIPLAEQQRIFERFARVTHTRRRSDGSGLGLSIVKAIAEAHGGHVTVHSNPGTGATFTLVLSRKSSTESLHSPVRYVSNSDR